MYVLCQLVMFLTVFFLWMYKMLSAAIKSLLLFMAGLFIGFLVEKCVACQNCVRGSKSLKQLWPSLIAFRN